MGVSEPWVENEIEKVLDQTGKCKIVAVWEKKRIGLTEAAMGPLQAPEVCLPG